MSPPAGGHTSHYRQPNLEDPVIVFRDHLLVVDGFREAEPAMVGLAMLAISVLMFGADVEDPVVPRDGYKM